MKPQIYRELEFFCFCKFRKNWPKNWKLERIEKLRSFIANWEKNDNNLEIFTKPWKPQNFKIGKFGLLLQIQENLTQNWKILPNSQNHKLLKGLENYIFLLQIWKISRKDWKNPPNSGNTKFCFSIVLAKFGSFWNILPHSWYYKILYINSLGPCFCACVCLWPLDAENSDGGRREKWREKNKTTVGWRTFEVLKPRSWDPGPENSHWGPETQVLRSRSWNLALRAWNPGPEIQVLKPRVEVLKPRSWEPNIEGLKPRSWERACLLIGWSN